MKGLPQILRGAFSGRYDSPAIRMVRIVALLAVASGIGLTFGPSMSLQDFEVYWFAARLQLEGGNPYDTAAMLAFQEASWPSAPSAMMMWNPPWTLALVTPLGLLSSNVAGLLWVSTNILALTASMHWFWRHLGGGEFGAWLVGLSALCFPASVLALGMGQITPIMLAGLCGFLHFARREQWMLAGAAAALTLSKPHSVVLVWVVLTVWAIRERRYGVLVGAAAVLATGLGLSLAVNPSIVGQYLALTAEHPPSHLLAPSTGVMARLFLGWDRTWLQFLPILFGAAWVTWYWMKRREGWEWERHIALLVLTSALVAAFAWPMDQVVFLIPLGYLLRSVGRGASVLAWFGLAGSYPLGA